MITHSLRHATPFKIHLRPLALCWLLFHLWDSASHTACIELVRSTLAECCVCVSLQTRQHDVGCSKSLQGHWQLECLLDGSVECLQDEQGWYSHDQLVGILHGLLKCVRLCNVTNTYILVAKLLLLILTPVLNEVKVCARDESGVRKQIAAI